MPTFCTSLILKTLFTTLKFVLRVLIDNHYLIELEGKQMPRTKKTGMKPQRQSGMVTRGASARQQAAAQAAIHEQRDAIRRQVAAVMRQTR